MAEYGGFIEFEYFHGIEYHEGAIALNSGRHCLEYLIRTKNIEKLYLPYFLCDSVKMICDKLKIETEYYHINENFLPVCEMICQGNEWIYIVNYYGQLSNEIICQMANQFGNIIIDNVQAFFQKPVLGIDTLYSCRKFFGVADGGYLYTNSIFEGELEKDFSYDRMGFLLGRLEKGAKEFYAHHVDNDQFFSAQPLKKMSDVTKNLMHGMEYEDVKNRRTENFAFLHSAFKEINRLKIIIPLGAYMYPLYIKNGSEIRTKLLQQKIYIPILWPNVVDNCKKEYLEYDMANNILPLPVDQRYSIEDMEFIAKQIEFFNGRI